MNFLYPAFLAGAAAIAIPIVLHLLRRNVAPEVPFTAVRLLRQTPLEQTRRRRLRELLLLLARVAALLLLAGAFARPYFADPATDAGLHVVAIDRSYSMGAPGTFARALDLARAAVDDARSGARVALVAFDDRAEVMAQPGPAAGARAALQDLRAGFGSTRYEPLMVRAIELTGQGRSRLTIVTDLQRAGWEDEAPTRMPGNIGIELLDAGAAQGNAGVVHVRRDREAIVASIRNDGPTSRTGSARLLIDGRLVTTVPFSAPANGAVDLPIPFRAPATGGAAVEIDDPGGYPADDRRYLVLDPPTRSRVLLVASDSGQGGFYLTRALQSEDGAPIDVRQVRGAALGRVTAQDMAGTGAVLLLSTKGIDRRGRDRLSAFVRGGGGLFAAAAADVEPTVLAAIVGWDRLAAVEQPADDVALAATDLRHPIFRPFSALAANLGQVRFSRAWRVNGDGWDVAARFTDGSPALLERRQGEGRVVLFASDVDRRWNDFPLHPSFVPFAIEAVRHVMTAADTRRDFLVANPPPDVRPEPGVYARPADQRRVAVNVDARESSTTRMTPDEFTAMLQPAAQQATAPAERRAQQVEARQSLWRYGLMLMLGALVAESVIGRSR